MFRAPIHSIQFTVRSSLYLNALRFIAAEFVLIAHLAERIEPLHAKEFYFQIANLGSWSVGIFFVLSGLLIGNSILNAKQKSRSFFSYFIDRFSRIYTGLIPSMIVVFIVDTIAYIYLSTPLKNIGFAELTINMLMLEEFPLLQSIGYYFDNKSVWLRAPFWGSDLPLWTLAIEWWLYMLSGWLILKNKRGVLFWVVLMFFSIVPLFQLFFGSRMGAGTTLIWFSGFAMLIFMNNKHVINIFVSSINHRISIFFSFLVTMGFYFSGHWKLSAMLFPIFLFSLLIKTQKDHSSESPISTYFEKLAGYSFTLYLIHYSIVQHLATTMVDEYPVGFVLVGFMTSNILAFIVASFFETKNAWLRSSLKSLFKVA
ncbi:MAG: acyltransferase family protein [Cryomorphaceae bacterium]|nr:acyltransferase family protein [Cryomorphaceae bacterium]